ncbi:GAF domain-containing protein, partial [Falsiroseomonas sp. E2-1-a20]|uniref:GAF domain-containing protein n=1 Tax=Falsiroseomonas sp. E2-1-a20 TaxID=3239300 RepID=UPI003F4100AD
MNCEDEQIHVPESIQPHGAFVAAQADSGIVTHASANLALLLGVTAGAALGKHLHEIFDDASCRALFGDERPEGALHRTCILQKASGGAIHLRSFRSGASVCVDIERVQAAPLQTLPFSLVLSVIETFRRAESQQELCELAVVGLQEITGFDRVMAYRFAEDGDGEVIAEVLRPPLQPYRGLRYPASDIPPQARRLYLVQRVGGIADCNYAPVPLVTGPALADGPALDLTRSSLRSVSPLHREYMRNMNTTASLTIGIPQGDRLWGMLVCHHATPRIAGPAIRTEAAMVGEVVALLLSSLHQSEIDAQRSAGNASLGALERRLATDGPLIEVLAAGKAELLQLVGAEGALLRCSGQVRLLGTTPPMRAAVQALAVLERGAAEEVVGVEDLGLRHPE